MQPETRDRTSRRSLLLLVTAVTAATCLLALPAPRAGLPGEQRGRGAAELTLDAAAVLAVVQSALPDHLTLSIPGAGAVRLEITPPASVLFTDGGVEGDLWLSVPAVSWESAVRVRYVPDVRAEDGAVRLVAESAEPDLFLPIAIDLASLLPAAEMPRRLEWSLDGPAGRPFAVQCNVHGLRIDDQRMVIELGVAARPGS